MNDAHVGKIYDINLFESCIGCFEVVRWCVNAYVILWFGSALLSPLLQIQFSNESLEITVHNQRNSRCVEGYVTLARMCILSEQALSTCIILFFHSGTMPLSISLSDPSIHFLSTDVMLHFLRSFNVVSMLTTQIQFLLPLLIVILSFFHLILLWMHPLIVIQVLSLVCTDSAPVQILLLFTSVQLCCVA